MSALPHAEPQVSCVQEPPSSAPWWKRVVRGAPGILMFIGLAAVLYAGHHHGWKLTKPGAAAAAASADWCNEHLVPESICVECREGLLPRLPSFGFCQLHGVAECVLDHPELAQLAEPPAAPRYDTATALALLPRPENNSRNTLHTQRVQFSTAASASKAGVDIDLVQERPMADFLTANGELVFDPTRIAHLSTRAAGTVACVCKTIGEVVQPGETLALVDAAVVGQTKSQLLQALVQLQLRRSTENRLRAAAGSGAVPQRSLLEAESALREAEIALISARQALSNLGFEIEGELEPRDARQVADELRFLGISAEIAARLTEGTQTANLIPIRATYGGTIVAADILAGEVVDPSQVLFTIADPRQLWLLLHVRQEDARFVVPGLPVEFRADSGGAVVRGDVAWISPALDGQTRTLEVRVVVENSDERLHDKTFGTARIILREEPHAIVVPREAVQSTADASFVFVRDRDYLRDDAPKVFHVRQVRLGARDDKYVELLAGALPGEVVATKGSPVLLAQLLRGNLGAGCGCHDK